MDNKTFTLNGRNINSINEFHEEVQRVLCPKFKHYGGSWDAFNDILRRGFGSFELNENIIIIFKNKKNMRKSMGEGFLYKIAKYIEKHEHIELKFE